MQHGVREGFFLNEQNYLLEEQDLIRKKNRKNVQINYTRIVWSYKSRKLSEMAAEISMFSRSIKTLGRWQQNSSQYINLLYGKRRQKNIPDIFFLPMRRRIQQTVWINKLLSLPCLVLSLYCFKFSAANLIFPP